MLQASGVEWWQSPASVRSCIPALGVDHRAPRSASSAGSASCNPLVAREWDLENGVAFDRPRAARGAVAGRPSSASVSVPPVIQDIAVVIPEDVPAATSRPQSPRAAATRC